MMPRFGRALRDSSDAWVREADAVSLPRLDEAVGGHPRPSALGVTYAEQEYQAFKDEQELLWPAEGEQEARSFQTRARGLDLVSTATEFLLVQSQAEVQAAHADHQHAARVLTPYVRREPGSKIRYWLCWLVLWFGDTAGVWSAAITNGDIPYVAFGQAFSAGLAAACAGLVGAELKYIRMARARQRDPESLTKDEQRYQHLLSGSRGGLAVVKLIGFLSLVVVALLATGIFALRSSIEGSASGLTFGCLAAATAIGSCLLGYAAADEVADLLAGMAKRIRQAEQRHLKLATSTPARQRAEADETARSLHAEYQVLGHGFPAGEQSGVIGRRPRRGGGA
jgi:hypothetical protein